MSITLHKGDLPDRLDLGPVVAVDSETMGLQPARDRLCVVQLSAGDGTSHLVQFENGVYRAPNLVRLLGDLKVTKLFHFARFDVAMFRRHLGVVTAPVYCTKIASKLARTFTDKHGQGPVQGAAERRAVEAAAVLGLGCFDPERGTAALRRLRRAASAQAQGEAGRDAGARGPHPARRGLLRLPARPRRARPHGLERRRRRVHALTAKLAGGRPWRDRSIIVS